MSSWQYAFLFPGAGCQLKASNAINELGRFGLEFDGTIRLLVKIDEQGHTLDVGEEVNINPPISADLTRRLGIGEQFSVPCRNSQIVLSCTFATQAANPHIFFGWSRKLFNELSASDQYGYWEMIRDFAKSSNAAYVVIVDDASDNFEDRFLEVNGLRLLDTSFSHSYGHGIQAVWVDESHSVSPPDGVFLEGSIDIGRQFRQYMVPAGKRVP